MSMTYFLVGYSKTSDRQLERYELPADKARDAKRLAGLGTNEDTGEGDLPLLAEHAVQIAADIGIQLDTDACDYFLEPYRRRASAAQRVRRRAGLAGLRAWRRGWLG
jgi:hypothetical protein